VSEAHTPADEAAARWSAVEAIFHAVLAIAPAQRAAVLDRACPDPLLRAEVESLLEAHAGHGAVDELADDLMRAVLPVPALGKDPRASLATHERYRIVDRLGGGGMGVVYRARDERLDRDVALKFLPPHLSVDQAAKKRFLVEARAAAALEHPNICTVHEIGDTEDGQLYIVMACYDGETLDQRIARGPLALEDALHITTEVVRGLGKAHQRGIVHRDIKPANVMITADGLVKILDFGIAKLSGAGATQTVGALGTLAYMSPEQAFAEAVDHRTDFWALGVMLYEMLAGTRPFQGPEQALLVAAMTAEPEPLATHRPDLPAGVDPLVRRLLAKKPEGRPASASDLLAALAVCTMAAPPVATAPATEPPDSALTRSGERRQVTVVHSVLAGADALYERLSPEVADTVLAQVRDAAADIATHHAGIVNHFASDGFTMLFGVPTAHEDDALRAVRAALALRERLKAINTSLGSRLPDGLQLRTGVHTGPVIAQRLRHGDRRFRITGAPAEVAMRLSAAATDGELLLSADSRRLAGPFVESTEALAVTLADGSTTATHRVLGAVDSRMGREVESATPTPFVGRHRERGVLADHLEAARCGNGHVSVIVGEAGAGKSRLVQELRTSALSSGLQVLMGRCDVYGSTTPFLPFSDAAQAALGLTRRATATSRHDDAVAAVRAMDASLETFLPLYLALLAIPTDTYKVPEQLRDESLQSAMLDAIAALFTARASTTPTLLVLEDWHWADDASRAALRQLAEVAPSVPLLLVVTARPEGANELTPGEQLTLLHVAPLDGDASAVIAAALFGAERVDADLVARLHERTGGNPFFLEEVCEVLREQGAVVVRSGTAMLADVTGLSHVPETVQGVLRTRMDRLEPLARDTLRVASVVGREFTRSVLEPVANVGAALSKALERLKGSGLVQQVAVVPEPLYRFKHALTQEVAYDSLLEHQRATLHAAVGRAIEERYAAHLDEQVERLVHHFSRAECWPDAVRYGVHSADRAIGLSQNGEALAMLERVDEWIERLPDDGVRRDLRADVRLRQERLCEVMGLRTRQLVIVEALIAQLSPDGPSERLAQAYLRQGDAFTLLRRFDEAEEALTNSRRVATARHDAAAERSALRSLALLRSHQTRYAEALAQFEQVMELAREADDQRAEAGDLASMANILRAMGQRERALTLLEAALERPPLNSVQPLVGANVVRYGALLNVIGTVHRELGNLDQALQYFRGTFGYLPDHAHATFSMPMIAQIQLERLETDAGLATFREAIEMTRKARYADGAAQLCRSYAEVLAGLDRPAEALPYLREAASFFRQLEDRDNEASTWRRVLALHNTLGIRHWERGEWAEAVSQFAAGLRLCEQESDRVHEGLMLNSLGASYLRLRQFDEAERVLLRSIHVTTALNALQLQGHARLTLARVYASTERVAEATAMLAAADDVARHLDDRTMLDAIAAQRVSLATPTPLH
jgi:predicted ATPase/class 3 adenylate cyclase